MPMGILLNIGCGGDIRSGYVNIDAFAEGDLKMDAGCLGFPRNSVDGVYSSHVLEHLSKHEIGDVLAEWNRVLKVTGTVEVIVPDFPWCLKQWLRLSERSRWDWALDTIFGLQNHPGEFHKTGFSAERLGQLLTEAGFRDVDISARFDHGMRSLVAVASGGKRCVPRKTHYISRWIRKHLVFLFYRVATYLSSGS